MKKVRTVGTAEAETTLCFVSNDFYDTEVRVEVFSDMCVHDQTLCWITYSDIDKFTKEIQAVIDKYKI